MGLLGALELAVASASGQAWAQQNGETILEPIIVEGVSIADEEIDASRQGTAVTVVTGEELKRQGVRDAAEALRSLPGVSVNRSGSVAGLTVVRLRGAEANHTLVLIDGIEANVTSDGGFDFAHLSSDQIARIEVIRGPQSGLYGSNALAGVINIVTKKGQGPLAVTMRGGAGAFATTDGSIAVSGGSDRFYANVFYANRTSDGFNIAPEGDERDGSSRRTFAFKGGVKPAENFGIDVVFRDVRNFGERDTEGGPAGTLAVQVDNPSFFESHVRLAALNAHLALLDGRWTHRLGAESNETTIADTSISSFGVFPFENLSTRGKRHYRTTLRLDTPALMARHHFTGLIEDERETLTSISDDGVKHERRRLSKAAEYRGEFFDRLFVAATIRHDDSDSLRDFTTWRTSAALKVPLGMAGLRLHGSAGTGVKFPTMFEQFGVTSAFIPNPNLRSEESFGWDAGAELSLLDSRAVVDVTYFKADLENEIETLFLPFGDPRCLAIGTFFCSTVENRVGKSRREGIEVTARLQVTDSLRVSGSYTRLNATDPDGLKKIRRPEHAGRLDIDLGFAEGRGNVRLSAIYNGAADDIAFLLPFFTPTRVTLNDYWLVNVAASYKVRPWLELFGRIENALDADYQEVYGFETAGRAAYGGLKLTFAADEPLEDLADDATSGGPLK